MPTNKALPTKKIQQKLPRRRGANVTYERFYAIRFSINIEKTKREVMQFFGISEPTYHRILQCEDFPAYRKLVSGYHDRSVAPKDAAQIRRTPVSMKGTAQYHVTDNEKMASDLKESLKLVQGVLNQANAIRDNSKPASKKKGFWNK